MEIKIKEEKTEIIFKNNSIFIGIYSSIIYNNTINYFKDNSSIYYNVFNCFYLSKYWKLYSYEKYR